MDIKHFLFFAVAVTILDVGFTSTNTELINNEEDNSAKIEGCVYTDAHWLECWWTEAENSATKYRLAYTRNSDPINQRKIHICEDEEAKHQLPPSTSATTVTKSCAIIGHMFSSYTVYLVTDACKSGDFTCKNGSSLPFECNPNLVYLTSPATQLTVNEQLLTVNWNKPNRPGSMLSFALLERTVQYTVEIKESDKTSKWNVVYEGEQTQISLPPLKPGTEYEVRVTSTLEPPQGDYIHKENHHEWGSTLAVTSFTTPIVQKHLEKEDAVTVGSTVIPLHPVSHHTVNASIAITVVSVVIVLIVLILVYLRCFSCNGKNKGRKPIIKVDFKKPPSASYGSNYPNNYDMESLTPISSLLSQPDSFPNNGSDICFQETEFSREFIHKRDHNSMDYKPTCRGGNAFDHRSLNTSLSINEVLSENGGNDSMCDETIRLQQQESKSDNEDENSASNKSSQCLYSSNDQSGVSTSPYSMPSYIMGPSNGNFIYSTGSVSSYVCGDSMYGDQGKWNSKSPKLSNYIVQLPLDGQVNNIASCVIAPTVGNFDSVNKDVLPKQTDGSLPPQRQMIVVVMCPNCQSVDCCQHSKNECINNQPARVLNVGASRRGSISDHSVDSGYSPDGMDSTVV